MRSINHYCFCGWTGRDKNTVLHICQEVWRPEDSESIFGIGPVLVTVQMCCRGPVWALRRAMSHDLCVVCLFCFPWTTAPCEAESRGTTTAVVCLVLLLLVGGVLAFLLWRYSNAHTHQQARTQISFQAMISALNENRTVLPHELWQASVYVPTKQWSHLLKPAYCLSAGVWSKLSACFLFRRHRDSNRGERLHDHLDDTIWRGKKKVEDTLLLLRSQTGEEETSRNFLSREQYDLTLHRNNV